MNTFVDPIGPLPRAVYWRRRAVILVLIVLLGGGAWTLFSAFSATPTATPTVVATPGVVAPCDPAVIELSATTDRQSYAEGELPQFSMNITNTGDVGCTLEVGSDKQRYRIASGSDSIWDSTVCQVGAEPFVQEFTAGQTVTPESVEWGRARSDNCDSGTPAVGGGASYQLTVFVGDIESAEPKQFMLY